MSESRLDKMLALYQKYHSDEVLIDMIIELRDNFLDHDLVSKKAGFDISDATVVSPVHVIFYIAEYIDALERKADNLQKNYSEEFKTVNYLHEKYIQSKQEKSEYRKKLEILTRRIDHLNIEGDKGMNPERIKSLNGNKVEEYYWAGKTVVYVNNKLSDYTFEQAVKELEGES